MRILQVITDTDRRGAQVFAIDLGDAMRERGHEVRTVALTAGTQSASALDVETLGASRLGLGTVRALRRLMSDVEITIAHGSTTGPACAMAGLWGHPFVYRQISDSRFWANTWMRRLRVAAFLRIASWVVALSEEAKATLVEHVWAPASRIAIVPNGVPIGQFHPPTASERAASRDLLGVPAADFLVGYVGALVPEKGVEDVLRAVMVNNKSTLVVAGDGPDRARLEAIAATGDNDRVRFVGPVADPMGVYAAVDAVVLPSRGGDSMPAGLIEAGFCALPTVATPVGSIEEIVVDGVTGVIVPPSSVGDLVSALGELRLDHEYRSVLGRNAEQWCRDRFEIGVVAERWLDVLSFALDCRR